MKKKTIYFLAAIVHASVSIIAFSQETVEILFIAGLPWSVVLGMVSPLVAHGGGHHTLLLLLTLAALFNSVLILSFGFKKSNLQAIDSD